MIRRINYYADGGYVSEYLRYHKSEGIDKTFGDLLSRVKTQIAREHGNDTLADGHLRLFRGRFSASSAARAHRLEAERRFEDQLIEYGAILHYTSINTDGDRPKEKGVDVLLAITAIEDALVDKPDMVVLFTPDEDQLPLVRALKRLGVEVVLVVLEAEYTNSKGDTKWIRVARKLKEEASSLIRC